MRFPDEPFYEDVLQEILSGAEYALPKCFDYMPDIIWDVGANVGAASVYYAFAFPMADIYAFEPSPRAIPHLRENIREIPRIFCRQFGLLDRAGPMSLYRGAQFGGQDSLYATEQVTRSYDTVPIRDSDAEWRFEHSPIPDLLKLDTEGAEVPILSSLSELIASQRISVIQLEYHSDRDRRYIDRLLDPNYLLVAGRARTAHRGIASYISQQAWLKYGASAEPEIHSNDDY
jgi:FkbM family methyltransferase